MYRICVLAIISVLLPLSSWAQEDKENAARWKASCIVVPVFHCAQHLEKGGAIGYFGYDLQCPEDAPAAGEAEVYIDINDNNLFSPGSKDRGQPKVFLSGEHYDEFEVDFSMEEVKGGSVIQWSVLGRAATVNFFKTKDEQLDCSTMSY